MKAPVLHHSALSESPIKRYITFVVLYFSQGIPEGITLFAIPAWMAMNGKNTGEIAAYGAVVLLPFSLKILFAPLMERYTWLPMGRRRPWLLLGQFGIMGGLLSLSFVPDPLSNMAVVTAGVLCVHVFIIFQDIATDSLVIDIVPLHQQGRANSLMWGSKTIGTSLSLFVGSWLLNHLGFHFALVIMAVPVLFIMAVPILFRERPGEKQLPWTRGQTSVETARMTVTDWGKLFRSFLRVVVLRHVLLLLLALFIVMAALHFMRTLLPVFTIKELGWDNVYYAEVFSTANLAGGIAGMLLGALIIQQFGIMRLIVGSMLSLVVLGAVMSMLSGFWTDKTLVIAFIGIFCTLFTLSTIGMLSLSMQFCWKRISAVQFTLCMTVANFGMTAGAALMGYSRSLLGWSAVLMVFVLLVVLALAVIRLIKTQIHLEKVDQLEKDYLAVLEAGGNVLVRSETA